MGDIKQLMQNTAASNTCNCWSMRSGGGASLGSCRHQAMHGEHRGYSRSINGWDYNRHPSYSGASYLHKAASINEVNVPSGIKCKRAVFWRVVGYMRHHACALLCCLGNKLIKLGGGKVGYVHCDIPPVTANIKLSGINYRGRTTVYANEPSIAFACAAT